MPESARPPLPTSGPLGWLRANLFKGWFNTLLTLLVLWALAELVPPLLRWAVADSLGAGASPQACRAAQGACWAFIHEKFRLILFGTYPYDQQWRPLLAMVVVLGLLLGSGHPRFWRPRLALVWAVGLTLAAGLMWGGVAGLSYVENSLWGGLPLTLLLTVAGLALAFPLAIALALGRRSRLPAVRAVCVAFIELIRGVPLISILFMASVMFPLFLPTGVSVDKLLRALVAMALFAAAHLAEVIRGGLQAIPRGQYEAAAALGLGYGPTMRRIILPQALALVIPPMTSTAIGFFKDTSLVIIIGLFDLLTAAKAALTDPAWVGFYREAYLFVSAIYWAFCFGLARYGRWLETEANRFRQR